MGLVHLCIQCCYEGLLLAVLRIYSWQEMGDPLRYQGSNQLETAVCKASTLTDALSLALGSLVLLQLNIVQFIEPDV